MSDDNVPRDEGLDDELLEDDRPEARASLPPLREVAEIRKPSTIGGVVYLGVLVGALAGITVAAAAPGSPGWRSP